MVVVWSFDGRSMVNKNNATTRNHMVPHVTTRNHMDTENRHQV